MKKEKYIGSVRFFKHLYLAILALIILLPSILAVKSHAALKKAEERLAAYEMPEIAPEEIASVEKEAPAGELSAREILSSAQLITHGLGTLDDCTTLNCLESFEAYYQAGIRVFEIDIRLTSDGRPVLRHDWRSGLQEGISEISIPTLEEFSAAAINGQYTPLTFSDLLLLMEQYPDICIITDTKFANEEEVTYQFRQMIDDAQALGLSYLFGRMIVQLYTEKMYDVVSNLYPFENYIYTLYYEGFNCTEDSFREKANFCQTHGIMGITMWDYWWGDAYYDIASARDLAVYIHTVNDPGTAQDLLSRGISAVYTDTLVPTDFEQ